MNHACARSLPFVPVLLLATVLVLCAGMFVASPQAQASSTVCDDENVTIGFSRSSMPYTGKNRYPVVTVKYDGEKLTEKEDYKVVFPSASKKVGTYTVKVKGKGEYSFTATRSYKITEDGGLIVDLSEHNGTVDFTKVAQKVDGVILRSYVTYTASKHVHKSYKDGNYRADYNYDEYATGCEKNGIKYGAYWYMVVRGKTQSDLNKDAKYQAKKFFNASFSNGHKPLYLVLDIEDALMDGSGTKIATAAKKAVAKLQELAISAGYKNGIKVGLYCGNHCYGTFGFNSSAGAKIVQDDFDFVWIPTYRYERTSSGKVLDTISATNTENKPSYSWDMWQYTSNYSLSGVSGGVDASRISASGPHGHKMKWYLKR